MGGNSEKNSNILGNYESGNASENFIVKLACCSREKRVSQSWLNFKGRQKHGREAQQTGAGEN